MSRISAGDLPVTPDGKYFVVKGRLWRMSNPSLDAVTRKRWVDHLMKARRDIGAALQSGDVSALASARSRVHRAKVALGERGPVWWKDSDADFNRYLAVNTPYAGWYRKVERARQA
jgi:hypothetical protein